MAEWLQVKGGLLELMRYAVKFAAQTSATLVLRGRRAVQARPQKWGKGRNFKVNFVTVNLEVIFLVSALIL